MMKYTWVLFPLFLLIAISYVKFSHKDDTSYFLWTGKIYTRADYYDRCKAVTEKWQNDSGLVHAITNPKAGNLTPVKFIRTDSYRNEDIYVFETKIGITDSSELKSIRSELENRLLSDEVLTKKYFNLIYDQNQLIKECDSVNVSSFSAFEKIQLKLLKINLRNSAGEFQRKLTYSFPENNSIEIIHPDNTRSFIIAITIALMLASMVTLGIKKSRN